MSLPQLNPFAAPTPAKFTHENGGHLRLQAFVIVRDHERRIGTFRIEGYEGWALPGETLQFNEDPNAAAERILRTWFTTPPGAPKLVDVLSYPATGKDDDRWYLLFVYEAEATPGMKGTPDTLDVQFVPAGKAPGEWAMSHADVFARLR